MIDFFVAVERGDIKEVEQQIEQFCNLHGTDYKGRTALHVAVERGHHDMIDLMIDRGIRLSAKDCGGCTALHLATELGHEKIVAKLLQASPELADERTQYELTCLHLAAMRGHIGIVNQLLSCNREQRKTNCADKDKLGMSALGYAVKYGHPDIVEVLLDSVKSKFEEAKKMFVGSLTQSYEHVALQLLAQHPELADTTYEHGYSALQLAAYRRCHAIVRQLLAQRPHLAEVGGTYGMSLLHFAAQYGYDTLMAELLVEKPQLLDDRDPQNGTNALHIAAQNGHEKIVSQLLAARPALATQRDTSGQTALHRAAGNEYENVVAQLLAHNPELINAEAVNGDTPLRSAIANHCSNPWDKTVTYLLSHGAVSGVTTETLWTLLRRVDGSKDEALQLLFTMKPKLIRSSNNRDTVLHCVFGTRGRVTSLFSQELMLQCWKMHPESLKKLNRNDDTPFHVAIRSNNKFAIELVQGTLFLDEVMQAFAKCGQKCPRSRLDKFFLDDLLTSLNKDVVGVIDEFLGFGDDKQASKNKRKRDEEEEEEEGTGEGGMN